MLRISRLTDYGTMVMAFLAKHTEAGAYQQANAREIATEMHLSVPTVSKLLKLLAHAGLLISHRGIRGGYQLAKSAETISVADIVNALEEKTGLTECSHAHYHCTLSAICTTQNNWQTLNRAIQTALASVSLHHLIHPRFQETMVDISAIQRVTL